MSKFSSKSKSTPNKSYLSDITELDDESLDESEK